MLVNAAAEEPLQTRNNNPRENDHLEYNAFKKEANGYNIIVNNVKQPFIIFRLIRFDCSVFIVLSLVNQIVLVNAAAEEQIW